ncbi:MAG: hypothetical protein ATN35_04510 [Epulopiscium sp. Nele67-Bin004]|nr:MAG: hypothetical protein ATN35_04510 [Epulopiscium sp. Nele67-Bin004]
MKVTKKTRVVINIMMTILLISLMDIRFTGMLVHEVFGVGLLCLFVFHFGINFKWMQGVSKNLAKVKGKTKVSFVLYVLLVVGTCVMGYSSVMISNEVFPMQTGIDYLFWRNLHVNMGYVMMLLVVGHVALHVKVMKAVVVKAGLAVMAFLGIKGLVSPNFASNNVVSMVEETQIQVAEIEV